MNQNKDLKWRKQMEDLSEMLKALSHPSRLTIMYIICNSKDKKMTVKSLYDLLEMDQPIMSRHLGILKNGGLLNRITEGAKTIYELKVENNNVRHMAKCFSTIGKG